MVKRDEKAKIIPEKKNKKDNVKKGETFIFILLKI